MTIVARCGEVNIKRQELESHVHGTTETAQVVWLLWGSRSLVRVPKRIDGLLQMEKWNDITVADRCKHNGMSWTAQDVLTIAPYAAKNGLTTT